MLKLVHDNYDERLRLAALRRSGVLDADAPQFEDIAQAAKALFGASAGFVGFVEADRQTMVAAAGMETGQTTVRDAFCAECVERRGLVWIEDASDDQDFAEASMIADGAEVRFYAGAPVRDREGWVLGAVCVMDSAPRAFDEAMAMALKGLAEVAASRVAWLSRNDDLRLAV